MKQFLPAIILVLYAANNSSAQVSPEHVFTLKESPAVVEGMCYDPIDKLFYFAESLQGRILKYSITGESKGHIDAASNGMTSFALGMTVSADRFIWICGSIMRNGKKTSTVFQYRLSDGSFITHYPDTSSQQGLFNDIAITQTGEIYITDTYKRTVFRVDRKNKVAVKYLQSDSFLNCNGITASGKKLYISTSRGFARLDTDSVKASMVDFQRFYIAGNDGLYFYNNSLIGIQNVLFPVSISRFQLADDGKRIDDGALLVADHHWFLLPTTGAVVGDYFYFMANTNIEFYDDNKKEPEKMKPIRVVRIALQ